MYHALLEDSRFLAALLGMDLELAAAARAAGCDCGGPLHQGNFARKPRGVPGGRVEGAEIRLSFCCGREGCRKRMTPASVRFLGRRVYWGVVVVIGAAFEGGVTANRVHRLVELIGYPIDRRTLRRWVSWWREGLLKSRIWKVMKGLFSRRVEPGRLPLSLLEMMAGPDAATKVTGVLELVSGRRIDRAI